jgi:hypothetical protein
MQIETRGCNVTSLALRIEALDDELFSPIAGLTDWDKRTLLALHAAVAARCATFSYLEIGSYLGGSLQAVMRDPRCTAVMSIDPRISVVPDEVRGTSTYEDNTTARMRHLLSDVPDVDMDKLATFESSTDAMPVRGLPTRPDYCFIDGEHTDRAVVRDARFCREAMGGAGLIAFHDYSLVKRGIQEFLREAWADVSLAIAFTGQVFALELGARGILREGVIDRAVASAWHSAAWALASSWRRSPSPFLATWSSMPMIDAALVRLNRRVGGR